MSQPTAVEIVTEIPSSPLLVVAGESVARIGALRVAAAKLDVRSASDAQAASAMLIEVQGLSKLIETRRVEAKAPFLEAGRRIDDAVKPHLAELSAAASPIKRKLADWQAEQDRIAREEEAKRQAELRRLEEERQKAARAAEEAAKKAAEASASEFADFDVDLHEKRAAQVQEAQANLATARVIVQPAKPTGISYRTTLKFEVVDVSKLPSALVTVSANETKIRGQFCAGWREGDAVPVCPGIRFTVDRQAVVNGRR